MSSCNQKKYTIEIKKKGVTGQIIVVTSFPSTVLYLLHRATDYIGKRKWAVRNLLCNQVLRAEIIKNCQIQFCALTDI